MKKHNSLLMFNWLVKLSNLIVIVLTGQGINCDILEFLLHRKNYSPVCTNEEDKGKSGYFQGAFHLSFDK